MSSDYKTIVDNRRAKFEYEVLEQFEAGLELTGTEVKSIRAGKANLQDAFVLVRNGEAWIHNMNISPHGTTRRGFNHDPTRRRRLLMHRKEINKIMGQIEQKGLTVIPLRLVLVRGWVKVHIAIAKGKKLYDKRQSLKDKATQRDAQRELKERYS